MLWSDRRHAEPTAFGTPVYLQFGLEIEQRTFVKQGAGVRFEKRAGCSTTDSAQMQRLQSPTVVEVSLIYSVAVL